MTKQAIINMIKEATAKSPLNHLGELGFPCEKMWEEPQAGFAAGDDPIFRFFKEDHGDFYWMPAEAFQRHFPGAQAADGELTVLSILFPQSERAKAQQRQQETEPCLPWMYSRNSWGPFIQDLSRAIVERLAAEGIQAAAIDLPPGFSVDRSEKYGRCANWSHRHAAHAAGLGTFGLCDGLITKAGKAVRFSTFILKTQIQPDPRPYAGHHDWCLFFAKGACNACMKICPAGAITEKGHDKEKCGAYLNAMQEKFGALPQLDGKVEVGCGLCQGPVPCQKGIPAGL